MGDSASGIERRVTDIAIVGCGPAGLTAGIYSARAGKKTIILEGKAASRLSIGYQLENYPGFISIDSLELFEKFKKHAQHFGAEIIAGDAINFNLTSDPKFVTTRDTLIEAKAVILATGRSMSKAKIIPGEDRLLGLGVSYCATCDGPLYRGSRIIALGNSDEAAEDVLLLNQMGCEVHWVSGDLEESKVSDNVINEIRNKNIHTYPKTLIKGIEGQERVEKVIIEKEGNREEFEVRGVFIFRDIPSAPLYSKAGVEIDHKQCVKVDRHQRTNLDGVFAAGDLTCGGLQVITAAGEGCVAAMQAIVYIRKKQKIE